MRHCGSGRKLAEESSAELAWRARDKGGRGDRVNSPNTRRRSRTKAWLVALISTVAVLVAAGLSLALTARTKSIRTEATCPLSGLPAPKGEVPERPGLAIKVDNYPAAAPAVGPRQGGRRIRRASRRRNHPSRGRIPVPGGKPGWPHPFGSGASGRLNPRPVEQASVRPRGGIPPVLSLISEADLLDEDLPATGSIVQNPSGRYPPYDTYVSTAAAWALQPGDTTTPAPIFTYATTHPLGTPVGSIHIPYSQTSDITWNWDPDTKCWVLSYSGTPATVANGARIAVPNVVVQVVHVSYGPWVEDAQGDLEVQARLTGSGSLMVFRNGVEVTGTWQRSSLESPTRLVAPNGSTIDLQPGETWVELVPNSIAVTVTASSSTPGSKEVPSSP